MGNAIVKLILNVYVGLLGILCGEVGSLHNMKLLLPIRILLK